VILLFEKAQKVISIKKFSMDHFVRIFLGRWGQELFSPSQMRCDKKKFENHCCTDCKCPSMANILIGDTLVDEAKGE